MFPHAEGAQHAQQKVDMSGELSIKHAADGSLVITHKPEEQTQFSGEPASVKTAIAKVKPVALTAVGAGAGLLVAGPLGALVGAGIGGAVDWYRHRKAAPAAAPAESGPTLQLQPIAMQAITKAAPNTPRLHLIKIAMKAKTATPQTAANPVVAAPDPNTVAANAAATALYNYFQQYPYDRILGDVFWKSSKTGTLVKAFQTAYNADSATNVATGPLNVSGFYDTPTAGALTFYTHNPVDPDPNT